jgi:hypothetical protein|tara:strand:+ start:6090 stop:6476 length:387 start_codon:yes stop_codon:yes gene_type:complete
VSTFDAYAYPPSSGVASAVGTPAAVEDEPELEAEAEAEATADAELDPELDADPDADPELEPELDAEAELELEPEPDELSELSRSLTDPPSSSPQLAAIKLNTATTGKANSKYFLDFKISSIYWGIRVT